MDWLLGGLVIIFLPSIVSLLGSNPVCKFLSLLFCSVALVGTLAIAVEPVLTCWLISWLFASLSFRSWRQREHSRTEAHD